MIKLVLRTLVPLFAGLTVLTAAVHATAAHPAPSGPLNAQSRAVSHYVFTESLSGATTGHDLPPNSAAGQVQELHRAAAGLSGSAPATARPAPASPGRSSGGGRILGGLALLLVAVGAWQASLAWHRRRRRPPRDPDRS